MLLAHALLFSGPAEPDGEEPSGAKRALWVLTHGENIKQSGAEQSGLEWSKHG